MQKRSRLSFDEPHVVQVSVVGCGGACGTIAPSCAGVRPTGGVGAAMAEPRRLPHPSQKATLGRFA